MLQQFRTRIKMCGMTRVEDVMAACNAGVDAIGLNFYPSSSRYVSLEAAEELAAGFSLMVSKVLLFVDADPGFIREAVSATNADILQFHGNESPEFCQQFGRRYIKVFRVKSSESLQHELQQHDAADAILLDAYVKGVPGGTGQAFDWQLIPEALKPRLMLAGGLGAENVRSAVEQIRPFAVDVAGGIEWAPGLKCVDKINEFVRQVRMADQTVIEN